MQVGDLRLLQFAQRARGFNDRVNVIYVDEAVAIGARHLVIHLGDHKASLFGGGQSGVYAHSEAAEAVGVGRRNLDQDYVQGHGTTDKQVLDFAEIDGGIVGTTVIDCVAHVSPDEHRVVPEVTLHFRSHVGSRPQGQDVHDFDIV